MLPLIISLFAVLIIALTTSLFCHWLIKGYWPANIASICYALLIFHGLAFLEAGSFDPYWMISSMVITAITLPITTITGTWLRVRKEKREKRASA